MSANDPITQSPQARRLETYYFARAAFSVLWVGAAFALGQNPLAVAALLVAYPAWDALANAMDAAKSGGLSHNRVHAVNVAVSGANTLAVFLALQVSMNLVLGIFGAWAVLSGLLQLWTGIRRWRTGAQWAMVLSGAQSALAGGVFIVMAQAPVGAPISIIAGYAALGALYFLISAVWLTVKRVRAR